MEREADDFAAWADHHPGAAALAVAVALARKIDPRLLRAARRELAGYFAPGVAVGVGDEAAVWFSPLVETRGPDGFTFRPAAAAWLRERLVVNPPLLEAAWAIVARRHERASPVVRWEEEVTYHALAPGPADRTRVLRELAASALKAIEGGDRPGLQQVLTEMADRVPAGVRNDPAVDVVFQAARKGPGLRGWLDGARVRPVAAPPPPDTGGFRYDVFFSYANNGPGPDPAVRRALASAGLRVFSDEDFEPGELWSERVRWAIDRSRVYVVILSEGADAAAWLRADLDRMRPRVLGDPSRRLVLISADGTRPPPGFSRYHVLRAGPDTAERLVAVCRPPAATGEPIRIAPTRTIGVADEPVWWLANSPDGKFLASASKERDGLVQLWDIAATGRSQEYRLTDEPVVGLGWADDGVDVATRTSSFSLDLQWSGDSDTHTRRLSSSDGAPGQSRVTAFASERGVRVFGFADGGVTFQKSGVSEPVALRGHTQPVYAVAVGPYQMVASGGGDPTVRLWNPKDGRCLADLTGHAAPIDALNFGRRERKLVSGSRDGTVRVWNVKTRRCLAVLEGHTGPVTSVRFADDGYLLTTSFDCTARVWDPESFACVAVLVGHTGPVLGLAFGPRDGTTYTGSADRTIREWRLKPGELSASPTTHTADSVARVVIVGNTGVGKTALLTALSERESPHTTLGDIEWWDYSGALMGEDFRQAVAGSDLIVVVTSTRDPSSVPPHADLVAAGLDPAIPAFLVWTMSDLSARSPGAAVSLAGRLGYSWQIQTSAKTGDGIEALIRKIGMSIHWWDIPSVVRPARWTAAREYVLALVEDTRRGSAGAPAVIRVGELLQHLSVARPEAFLTRAELDTVLGHLHDRRLVARLPFGDWVVLRPELLAGFEADLLRGLDASATARPSASGFHGGLFEHDFLRAAPVYARFGSGPGRAYFHPAEAPPPPGPVADEDEIEVFRRAAYLRLLAAGVLTRPGGGPAYEVTRGSATNPRPTPADDVIVYGHAESVADEAGLTFSVRWPFGGGPLVDATISPTFSRGEPGTAVHLLVEGGALCERLPADPGAAGWEFRVAAGTLRHPERNDRLMVAFHAPGGGVRWFDPRALPRTPAAKDREQTAPTAGEPFTAAALLRLVRPDA